MRHLSRAVAIGVLGVALGPPAAAAADISSFKIARQARLGADGTTVTLAATINCLPATPGFPDSVVLSVSQSHGSHNGFGVGFTEFECSGVDQRLAIVVPRFDAFGVDSFRQGKAVVSGCFNSGLVGAGDLGPAEIQVRKHPRKQESVDALADTFSCVD